jgi:hypothetical protein
MATYLVGIADLRLNGKIVTVLDQGTLMTGEPELTAQIDQVTGKTAGYQREFKTASYEFEHQFSSLAALNASEIRVQGQLLQTSETFLIVGRMVNSPEIAMKDAKVKVKIEGDYSIV